eukprot:jgi/Hompol1/1990/HPOL_002111-RA
MAGGSPFEIYNLFGLKVPRYQMAGGMIAIYVALFATNSWLSSLKPKPPIKFESKAEEDFVKKYIHHAHQEAHKPVLLRTPFSADH